MMYKTSGSQAYKYHRLLNTMLFVSVKEAQHQLQGLPSMPSIPLFPLVVLFLCRLPNLLETGGGGPGDHELGQIDVDFGIPFTPRSTYD